MLEIIENVPCITFPPDKLNLVLFGSSHCTPCHFMKDKLQFIEDKFLHKFNFYYIDIMKNPDIANQYSIKSIPTIIIFNENTSIRSVTFSLTQNQLIDFLNDC